MACAVKSEHCFEDSGTQNSKSNCKKKRKKYEVQEDKMSKPAENAKKEQRLPPMQLDAHQQLVCEQHYIKKLTKVVVRQPKALFVCTLCQYFCNSWCVVENHIQSQRHVLSCKDALDDLSIKLLPRPLKEQIDYISRLIVQTVQEHGMTAESRKQRYAILNKMNDDIQKKFPECSLMMYGSSGTAMGLNTSDVNMNLAIPTTSNLPSTMICVYDLISSDKSSYKNVQFDATTDNPTITFMEVKTNLRCTVCLDNKSACDMTELLVLYASVDSRVTSIIIVFRLWAHLCSLDRVDFGTLPAHAFALLVIFYFQQLPEPILPVLSELLKPYGANADPKVILKEWKSTNKMSLGELWLGLLKFYLIDFQTGDKVVSIQSSKPVKRSTKKWSGNRIAIEDPIAPFKNISKTLVHGKSFNYFMSCLRASYLYFATLQTTTGPIFRRVQKLPSCVQSLDELLRERERFLKFVLENNHYFQTDENLTKKLQKLDLLSDPAHYSYEICEFIVTPEQADLLFKKFNPRHLFYQFTKKNLTNGKTFPMVCVSCREEGHHKDVCPEESLPPLEKLPEMSEPYLKRLSAVCETVCSKWTITNEEFEIRMKIVKDLQNFLRLSQRNVSLNVFGSTCNGFGQKASDIDICLTFIGNIDGKGLNFTDLIEELYVILSRCRSIYNLVPITTAKVPILKFTHRETGLNGDISFYNTLAQQNTKLLWTYSGIDRRAKYQDSS